MRFFPLTLFHGAAGAKTCIRCAQKKSQSRSDYFEGAKRHNIVSTVAKRLSRPFRHRFRCSIPRRRRCKNMYPVCQKKTSREATICRREAPTTRRRRLLLAPKAPGAGGSVGAEGTEGAEGALQIVGAEGAWCRGLRRCRRHRRRRRRLTVGAEGAWCRGIRRCQRRRRRLTNCRRRRRLLCAEGA